MKPYTPLLLAPLLLPLACRSSAVKSSSTGTGAANESQQGWISLFDGRTTDGWRGFNKDHPPEGWQVVDGCLTRVGPGGDLITEGQYDNFILRLEWKIAPGGNSGIFFHVTEDADAVWRTGPEYQVLDNGGHPDGASPLTSAGANYALNAPLRDVTRPVGEFNETEIEVHDGHVRHRLNGVSIVTYELWTPEWEALVAASKFGKMPRYGRNETGHIALQDHGDTVWYRNIRILPLD